jgi:hypothetical protein
MRYCLVSDDKIINVLVCNDAKAAAKLGALPCYEDANIGDVYSPPAPPMTEDEARAMRDKLLAESDWTQMPDSPLSDEQREAYRVYRQALRDITAQEGFPASITWPELPSDTK